MRMAILSWILLPTLAWAQVPAKLSYQGRLLKADGTPETGVLSMTFSLYDAPGAGTQLWTETQQVALSDGFYSVSLGDAKPLEPAVFDGSERYLEVGVGIVALLPRQRMNPVPYALAAGSKHAGRNLIDWTPAVSKWTLLSGALPTITLNKTDVREGDSSFDVAVTSGATGASLAYGDFIPVDPSRRYEGRISAQLVSGAGSFSAGCAAYDANKAALTSNGPYRYFVASAQPLTPAGAWNQLRGQIAGEGTLTNQFPANTRFIRPVIVVNDQSMGVTRIDAFEIYEVSDQYVSPWTLITADGLTHNFPHGLGAVPSECRAYWSPNANGSPRQPLPGFQMTCNTAASGLFWRGMDLWVDATNVSMFAYNGTGGNLFCSFTNNTWTYSNSGYVQVVCKP